MKLPRHLGTFYGAVHWRIDKTYYFCGKLGVVADDAFVDYAFRSL